MKDTKEIILGTVQSILDESFVDAGEQLHTLLNIRVKNQLDTLRESIASTLYEDTTMRLVKTHKGDEGRSAKVYKDKDWGEHRVKFYKNDKHIGEKSDYHSDDIDDANGTALAYVNGKYAKK